MTLSLELYRSVGRYLAARAVGPRLPGLLAGPLSPLRLVDVSPRPLPGEGWVRVRPILAGICGSDLNTLSARSSLYFSALVSMPFVPGHEVVGELLDDVGDLARGQRVVLDPVLACAARGISPSCEPCQAGTIGLCDRVAAGHLKAGLQTGYCADTGGGWSQMMLAHRSQLHPVPDELPNAAAVMVEPMACALHAVRRATVPRDATVLIVGAGTVGLLVLVALAASAPPGRVIVVAKHAPQAALARALGATEVIPTEEALGAVRRATRSFRLAPEHCAPFLLGGADVSFECAGSSGALDLALRATRGGGTVMLAGMPAAADLSPAWFRELELRGAYSGCGSFEEAIELAGARGLENFVSGIYPLGRWHEAIDHAMSAGRLGGVKVAFEPRQEN
ncbi:MAG: zinc-dependent alcohol dehydrogenase [Actinomycetota bacterium]